MLPASFVEYALSGELDDDAVYTISLLIDRARIRYDEHYYGDWEDRLEAEDGAPCFNRDHVRPAAKELDSLGGVSLQRYRRDERPVRDLTAFRYLPLLRQLCLQGNEPSSLAPLVHCPKLDNLHLSECGLRNISPIAELSRLETLNIAHNPVSDLSALEKLPSLRSLTVSVDQIPALEQLSELSSLRRIEFAYDDEKRFKSFVSFPAMPELRIIWGAEVDSLEGLERYTKLENITNCGGSCPSLAPIADLEHLTHANILGSEVTDLSSVAGLGSLRSLCLYTDCEELDLTPLASLPKLHEVSIVCAGQKLSAAEELAATLSSWDEEFLADEPRYIPNSQLEVVDQETFDYFDTKAKYGVGEDETNERMLSSELQWLDEKLEGAFSPLIDEDDYTLPDKWPGGRSRTVVLYSPKAIAAFPAIITRMQEVLANTKNDWILYFQSDRFEGGDDDPDDFTVWVYPEKIQCIEAELSLVRSLMGSGSQELPSG